MSSSPRRPIRIYAKPQRTCATPCFPPKAAKTFINAFEEAVGDLSTFPEGRPLVSDFDLAKRGYRWIPVGKFMLFYTTDRDAHTVVVERLLYGPRDWAAML